MTPEALREHFPHTEHQMYLNHAAVSPMSRPVREAIDTYVAERHGADPDAPIANFESFFPMMEETKERLATVLGTSAARVEFVPNTSAGLNVLARGLDWEEGDRIAVPDGAFPTNVYPFLNLEPEGVEVDFVPTEEGAYTVDEVEDTLRPETRLLSVSWVHFLSGFRADLEALGALCEKHDVLFCVDAIQGLGALQMDVEAAGIDFLTAGGHKWLMAAQGIGVLYCDEALQDDLRPPAGWLHGPIDWANLDDYELTFHEDARRFRTGTLNSVGVAALHAALGLYLDAGPEWCEERVLRLSTILADELSDRGLPRCGTDAPAHASGIVTVAPDAPEALFEHLKTHGITGAVRNQKLRLAPTYYNDQSDLRAVLRALDAFGTP
ncbi:aminotransferase class V-fold PLP-dependent enzyme [Salinibacter ruber]|uniref:aminotransferase class V-fold PLP-dependent enzyme n=1 Tax=Salinibacter ruber TaxID=146919 RepID=UPI002167926B|nr:aminotransferase class V-fold PLP-dependent enzyme [Salinibacter ruber]MCS4200208.1 selenocysteine lyase/cysteine desulfurase [Salinibacter ruber]